MDIERGLVKTSAGYLHYRATGVGEVILLAHINQQSSALYLELMQALGGSMRAVAVDYPSHGQSDPITEQPTIPDYARWIVEVADALGIAQFSVLGEAVGAAMSIELAVAHAARVNKAVLVNCPYYQDRGGAHARHTPLKSGLRPADASGFPLTRTVEFLLEHDPGHAPMHPTQSWMDRVNVSQIEAGRHRWQALDALHQYDIADNLGRMHCPTLLLIGEHFYYLQHRQEFHNKNNKLKSEVIAGARFCMTWERADEIAARTIAFLRS